MFKELYFAERNINGHVLGSKNYDSHLRHLRNIYTENPIVKDGERWQHPNQTKLIKEHGDHVARAHYWESKEKALVVIKENQRILDKISNIQSRKKPTSIKQSYKQEEYRNLQLHNLIHRKK